GVVRRSVTPTYSVVAGSGRLAGRSDRRNTIPCPAGAGLRVTVLLRALCKPVPLKETSRASERLPAIGFAPREPFQVVDQGCQSSQRGSLPQDFPMRTGRVSGDNGPRGDVANDSALGADPSALAH